MLISGGQMTISVSGGSGTANTQYIRGIVRHILVKPSNENAQYSVSIVNPAGIKIYERTSETGTLSELTTIPVLGIYTVSITFSTSDGSFITQLICQE